MNIRKTHPNDTTSISLDYFDIEELLKHGFTHDKDAGVKLALNAEAKEALIERDAGIFKEGQMHNDEVQALVGKIRYAIRIADETASDYARLAKELNGDVAAKLEFTYMAAGIREAVVNLRNLLTEQFDGKQD